MEITYKHRHAAKKLIASAKLIEMEDGTPVLVGDFESGEKRAKVTADTVTSVFYGWLRSANDDQVQISLVDDDDVVRCNVLLMNDDNAEPVEAQAELQLPALGKVGGGSLGEAIVRMQGESALQAERHRHALEKRDLEQVIRDLEKDVMKLADEKAEAHQRIKKLKKRLGKVEAEKDALDSHDRVMNTVQTFAPMAAEVFGRLNMPTAAEGFKALAGAKNTTDATKAAAEASPRAAEIDAFVGWLKSLPETEFTDLMRLMDSWGGEYAEDMAVIVRQLAHVPTDIKHWADVLRKPTTPEPTTE